MRALFTSLLLVVAVATAWGQEWVETTLAAGKAWETSVHTFDTGRGGPTVLLLGGVHGDEPAGALALDQIRHWTPTRGKLVVIPRVNPEALRAGKRRTPGVARKRGDLNRNFPRGLPRNVEPSPETRAYWGRPRGERAATLWGLIQRLDPHWVVDLHEGYDVHRRNPKSVGSTVILARHPELDALQGKLLDAVNATIPDDSRHFLPLRGPIQGSIAAAAHSHGARAMILETTTGKQRLSLRIRQHRILVAAVLRHLSLLSEDASVDAMFPAERVDELPRVALYDAGGTSGGGVSRVRRLLAGRGHVQPVGPDDIRAGALAQFDVVVFSGGSGSAQSKALGPTGRQAVRDFVEDGGGYLGICAGAYLACRGFSWGVGVLDAKTVSNLWRRGSATVELEFTEAGLDLLDRETTRSPVRYANGPILMPLEDPEIPDYDVLAVFRTEVAKNGTPKGVMVNSPAIASGRFGKGRVVAVSPHPEATDGLTDIVPTIVDWLHAEDAEATATGQ